MLALNNGMLNKQPHTELQAELAKKRVTWAEDYSLKHGLGDYDTSTDYSEGGDGSDGSEGQEKVSQTQSNAEADGAGDGVQEQLCSNFSTGYCLKGTNCPHLHAYDSVFEPSPASLLKNYPELLFAKTRRMPSFLQ